MTAFDFSDLIDSFANEADLEVERCDSYTVEQGIVRDQSWSVVTIASAVVAPLEGRFSIEQDAEGDRPRGLVLIGTHVGNELRTASIVGPQVADIARWNGERYRVTKAPPYARGANINVYEAELLDDDANTGLGDGP